MGLAISRMIVEAHNGKIGYSENANRGLTLWVRLPNHLSRTAEYINHIGRMMTPCSNR